MKGAGGRRDRTLKGGLAAAVFVAFMCWPRGGASAAELTGRASIIDADTIEIHGQRIGFYGIGAPESPWPTTGSQGHKAPGRPKIAYNGRASNTLFHLVQRICDAAKIFHCPSNCCWYISQTLCFRTPRTVELRPPAVLG